MVRSTTPSAVDAHPTQVLPAGADRLALAADPGTPPDQLVEIQKQFASDPSIQATLARNPATPQKLLLRLWRNDPAAILENPIVTFWEFSKPGSAKEHISFDIQFALYQHLLLQPDFEPSPHLIDPKHLVACLGRPSRHALQIPLHLVLRDNRAKIRFELLEYQVPHASRKLGRPVGFPHDDLVALASSGDRGIHEALAAAIGGDFLRPDPLDIPFLGRLARLILDQRGQSFSIPRHIAKWPCIDSDIVEKLARRADDHFLSVLAAHPQASHALQERLATHPSESVRAGLAAATPLDHLIQRLSLDPNPIVRAALASSPHIQTDIQQRLFEKKDPRILQSLLANPHTAPEILAACSRLRFLSIEHRLRTHPNTPPDVLARLSRQALQVDAPMPPGTIC
jgi:hypothetical protein